MSSANVYYLKSKGLKTGKDQTLYSLKAPWLKYMTAWPTGRGEFLLACTTSPRPCNIIHSISWLMLSLKTLKIVCMVFFLIWWSCSLVWLQHHIAQLVKHLTTDSGGLAWINVWSFIISKISLLSFYNSCIIFKITVVIFSTANDDYVIITQVYSYRHNLISYFKTNIKRWFDFGLVAISSCSYIDVRGINSNIPVKPAILWKLISTCTIFKVILLHVCTTIQNKTTLDNISFSLSTIDRHSK